MKDQISIIFVHWNTPELLKKQLKNLAINDKSQLIVVDNASAESIDWVRKDFTNVDLIKNNLNRGFAFACNQGTMSAVGEWLLFLNPDVTIKPNQISEMLDFATKNNLDACSVATTSDYHKPLPSWQSLLVEFSPFVKLIPLSLFKQKTLFGGCLLIKRKVLLELGGWNERFFLWFEDSDLTKRLLDNHHKIGWAPVKIKHEGGISFKQIDEQTKRDIFFHSMEIFAKKYFSFFGRLVIKLIKCRYTTRQLLPEFFSGASITVPNIIEDNLNSFFENNSLTSGVEWIVVTNSIENKNIWSWRKKYPSVRFIPIDKNRGYASTVNIGFRVSTGRWVGTINDDTIFSAEWITKCLRTKESNIGSINPVIKYIDNTVETAGIDILPIGKARVRKQFDSNKTTTIQVEATNAAAVIYSKEALNKVGLFDEKFGSYLEDIDLSLRLSRRGYKNLVNTQTSITHIGRNSSYLLGQKKQFLDFKNWIIVILKNWGIKKIILNLPSILIERLRNISGFIKSLT